MQKNGGRFLQFVKKILAYEEDRENFVVTLLFTRSQSYNGTRRISKGRQTYALFVFFFSFIVKSSDGKVHMYILRAVELTEGTLAKHPLKMPVDGVRKITAKLELLEPQMN